MNAFNPMKSCYFDCDEYWCVSNKQKNAEKSIS